MIRCLLHGSTGTRGLIWFLGVIIWLFLCGACFTGYSLVYGQMSLWAIVVICSLVTAVPVIGASVLELLWGGSVVSGVTVNRFFGIHFVLPLVLLVLVLAHLAVLHLVNSSGEAAVVLPRADRVNFYPLLLGRDAAIVCVPALILGACAFWDQDRFGHPDNYVPANPMVTPALIAPEWYFLPFYGVIRAIPHKALGIVVMAVLIVCLLSFSSASSMAQLTGGATVAMPGVALGVRTSAMLWVLDMVILSEICLMVNHAESLYWVLVAAGVS